MAHNEAYYEAEKKIAAARQLGATELDLRDMQLRELPGALVQLTQLQSLDLSRNGLSLGASAV
jgi:hypothetical protein